MSIPGDAPVVGTVFRMSEEKQPLLWMEIAAGVRRAIPDARFLVVGDGPLREAVELRAQREDLNGAVHFAGYDSQPLRAIVDMDLFLLTSRAEGLPNVLIEAQAVGVPVVTTPVGGAPETIDHGRTGVVLEGADPTEVAAVLVKQLSGHLGSCSRLSAWSARWMRRLQFTTAHQLESEGGIDQWHKLIRSSASNSGRTGSTTFAGTSTRTGLRSRRGTFWSSWAATT